MKKIVSHTVLVGSMLVFSQALLADMNNSEEKIKKETAKEEIIKTDKLIERSLIMDLGQESQLKNEANLDLGKIEFYVK